MESLFFSPIALAVFFILYTILKVPSIARKGWARLGGMLSALLFLASLLGLFLRLHSGTVAQYDASGNVNHAREVFKITNHLEELLEGGKYTTALELLKEFNTHYPGKSRSIHELRIFVDDLLKKRVTAEDALN